MELRLKTLWLNVCLFTCHVVVHPVEHDLWGSVPPGGYVACHFIIGVPGQTKVQDLSDQGTFVWNRNGEMSKEKDM